MVNTVTTVCDGPRQRATLTLRAPNQSPSRSNFAQLHQPDLSKAQRSSGLRYAMHTAEDDNGWDNVMQYEVPPFSSLQMTSCWLAGCCTPTAAIR